MAEFFETCRRTTGSDAEPVWVSEEFLQKQGVAFWSDLPLCSEAAEADLLAVSLERAVKAGLTWRPVATTIAGTRAWDEERGSPPLTAGLSAEREAELLTRVL
jgi:2'-hydroxyisoflavone reductase